MAGCAPVIISDDPPLPLLLKLKLFHKDLEIPNSMGKNVIRWLNTCFNITEKKLETGLNLSNLYLHYLSLIQRRDALFRE